MAMRMSSLFLRTLRENPVDAEVPSHQLLVRAGYIRRVSPGIYTWLPLGLKVLKRVEQIVREEMDAIGAQELLFPALLPREPYEATGRWTEYGDGVFRLKDRKDGDYLLGPTHEEMFTLAVKDLFSSYKDLPVTLYQIQTKYRDEARPRAGILRGREFVMKDSYSFDIDDSGLDKSYQLHRDAYVRLFDRLGFHYVIVQAMAGAMGGSKSEEFLATADNGEDTYVRCANCAYAANVEAVKVTAPQELSLDGLPPMRDEDTPDAPTIASLVEPLAIGIPGDREVDEKRLAAQVEPARVEAFEEKDFAAYPTLVKGYMGPLALGSESESAIRFLVDPRVVTGTRWVAGGNKPGVHTVELVAGRDFVPDATIEAAEVRPGDACPNCGNPLESARGIEMGHIFQLGRKYAEALDLKVLDENGKLQTVTMGSYGFGVSRAVACIAEGNNDQYGLVWPRNISPADVHIVAAGKDEAILTYGEELTRALEAAGVDVIFDDRKQASPGVKFKDAELIGVPTIVVVGKGLADGKIEIKDRRSGERRTIAIADAVESILAEIGG